MGKVITAAAFVKMFNATFWDHIEWISEEIRTKVVYELLKEGYDPDEVARMSDAFSSLQSKAGDSYTPDYASDLLYVSERDLEEDFLAVEDEDEDEDEE